jgi:hypothetical protein
MAAVGTVGRSQPPVDCGVGLCGLGCLGSMAYLTWARAASRRLFDRLRGFELNCVVSNCATSNCVVSNRVVSGCASDGLSGWLSGLGSAVADCAGHALSGLELPGRRLLPADCAADSDYAGSGAKSRALCGLESSCLPPCGLGSGPSPDGLSGLGLCVSGRKAWVQLRVVRHRTQRSRVLRSPVARSAGVSPEGCAVSGCAV